MSVFISYRRSDTKDLAGRIADRLKYVPQIGEVFIDVDGIAPGADFEARIREALSREPVCIVLIGPGWLGRGAGDQPQRIADPTDFIRLEVKIALASTGRLLPVLANGATMPSERDLPDEIKGLARINALAIRHEYFDHDVGK